MGEVGGEVGGGGGELERGQWFKRSSPDGHLKKEGQWFRRFGTPGTPPQGWESGLLHPVCIAQQSGRRQQGAGAAAGASHPHSAPSHPPRLVAQQLVVSAHVNHAGQHTARVEATRCGAGGARCGGVASAQAASALGCSACAPRLDRLWRQPAGTGPQLAAGAGSWPAGPAAVAGTCRDCGSGSSRGLCQACGSGTRLTANVQVQLAHGDAQPVGTQVTCGAECGGHGSL